MPCYKIPTILSSRYESKGLDAPSKGFTSNEYKKSFLYSNTSKLQDWQAPSKKTTVDKFGNKIQVVKFEILNVSPQDPFILVHARLIFEMSRILHRSGLQRIQERRFHKHVDGGLKLMLHTLLAISVIYLVNVEKRRKIY